MYYDRQGKPLGRTVVSYIPPDRRIETSRGEAACVLCCGYIEDEEKYIYIDNTDMCICLPCCDCLAASADDARYEGP